MTTDLCPTRFECMKNAFYHEDREQHFARLHRYLMFAVTLSGTAAFAAIVTPGSWLDPRWLTLSTTALGLVDLVFDWSGQAREHASLRRRFLDLYGEIEAGETPPEKAKASMYRLFAEEPTTYRAANAVAYNNAMQVFDRSSGDLLVIPLWRRWSRHWLTATTLEFPRRSEVLGTKQV